MSSNVNMLEGPIQRNIIRFALPLIFTNFLSMTYNLCDQIILGRFVGTEALAAVSSSSYIIGTINCLFIGISVGINIISARAAGSRDYEKIDRVLHTSVGLAVLAGIIITIVGILFSKPILRLTNTPESIIDSAAFYMRIYFLGCPINLLSASGGAILRSQGNTKITMIYSSISGAANVFLNLVLVVGFNMEVGGVAVATLISQAVSCVLILKKLMSRGMYGRLELKRLTFDYNIIKMVVKVGIPAGMGSLIFNVSNTQEQSYINSFGTAAIAGNHAASSLIGIIYTCVYASMATVAINFISQNMGAKNPERARKILTQCIKNVVVAGLSLSILVLIFRNPLLKVYIDDNAAIAYGAERVIISVIPSFIWGISEVFTGSLRGLGFSVAPTVIPLICTCGVRFLWLTIVFSIYPVIEIVFVTGSICGLITAATQIAYYFIQKKKTNSFKIEKALDESKN